MKPQWIDKIIRPIDRISWCFHSSRKRSMVVWMDSSLRSQWMCCRLCDALQRGKLSCYLVFSRRSSKALTLRWSSTSSRSNYHRLFSLGQRRQIQTEFSYLFKMLITNSPENTNDDNDEEEDQHVVETDKASSWLSFVVGLIKKSSNVCDFYRLEQRPLVHHRLMIAFWIECSYGYQIHIINRLDGLEGIDHWPDMIDQRITSKYPFGDHRHISVTDCLESSFILTNALISSSFVIDSVRFSLVLIARRSRLSRDSMVVFLFLSLILSSLRSSTNESLFVIPSHHWWDKRGES